MGNLTLIQDARSSQPNSIEFYKIPNEQNTEMEVTGIGWFQKNIARNNGLKLSFKPTITVDNNYNGLQKYPQGFAFILTSNPTNNIIGEKRSGIGFEGIYNSIAFFFDFIYNQDKMDIHEPHFSITYNLNGQVKSLCQDKNLCNMNVPNFYDNEIENYIPNMKISLEIYAGKIKIYFNDINALYIRDLPEFGYIMDNDEVYLGISSSMTLYKAVKIEKIEIMSSKLFTFSY